MKVFLDTTSRFNIVISLNRKTFKSSQDAFSLLKGRVKEPHEIKEIDFNRGPGSFTSLRVGAAIVNALRYGLGLAGPRKILLPQYGKEPSIGKKLKL